MARRRRRSSKRRSPTRYKSAFNLKNAVFAYANLHIASNAIVGTSPYNFLTAGYLQGSGSGWQATGDPHSKMLTLKEIIAGAQQGSSVSVGDAIKSNLVNNAAPAVLSLIGLKVAEKAITSMGVSRNFNKVVRSLGMGSMVKM